MTESGDTRASRIGRNEAFFRQVNERVRDVNEAFSILTEHGDFVCECGDAGCVERIQLTMEQYAQVRSDATLFAIVPGHEMPEVEDVVADHGGYVVVRKKPGEPAEVARALDGDLPG